MAKHDVSAIVVGGGIIGASIAWHLVQAGCKVTVVAEKPGGVATPASFSWINASFGNPEPYFRLRRRAMAEWTRLAQQVPGLPHSATGGLCWDLQPADLMAFERQHGQWGYDVRRVGRADIARLEPNILETPDHALHVASEGSTEPVAVIRMLLDLAGKSGATIIQGREVVGLSATAGRIDGVETTTGHLRADHVIVAAGIRTRELAATMGIDVPMQNPTGLIVHSKPHAKLLNGLVFAPDLHMRQTVEGRIIAGADFGGSEPGEDANATAARLFGRLKASLRGSDTLELDFYTVADRPTPVDGFPVVGGVEGYPGLFLAVMHSGVTLAPAIGLFAAREIVDGLQEPLLAPYRLARFSLGSQ